MKKCGQFSLNWNTSHLVARLEQNSGFLPLFADFSGTYWARITLLKIAQNDDLKMWSISRKMLAVFPNKTKFQTKSILGPVKFEHCTSWRNTFFIESQELFQLQNLFHFLFTPLFLLISQELIDLDDSFFPTR